MQPYLRQNKLVQHLNLTSHKTSAKSVFESTREDDKAQREQTRESTLKEKIELYIAHL